jgi:hypothetical protein
MAEPGDIATAGRTGSPFGVESSEVARGLFGRCTACNWTTTTAEVAHSVVSHVAHFGHDVMIVEHVTRIVCPQPPKPDTER